MTKIALTQILSLFLFFLSAARNVRFGLGTPIKNNPWLWNRMMIVEPKARALNTKIHSAKIPSSPARAPRPGDEQAAQWLKEYVRRRESGDLGRRDALPLASLREKIAEHYKSLVESIARRFNASGEPFEDLVQEGFLGLLSALDKYDPSKNVKFSTYATHFIAGAMNHFLRDRGKIIKEPAWLHEVCGKINRVSETLTQTLGRAPHPGEIAVALNLTEEAVEEILSTRQVFAVASFESDVENDMTGMVDPEKIKSDKHVTLQLPIEDRIVLESAVENLKVLEQKVLYEFFYKDLNQTEIARKFNISCNYVSHILKNSTKKLRRIMGEAEVRDRTRHRENSVIDSPTGLYTATHMKGRLEEEITRAARAVKPLTILVIVLDGLPQIAGHRRDEIWGACGDAVRKSLRRVDIAGRYEGNSLLILLPETREGAIKVADRLCDRLLTVGVMSGEHLTVRAGVAHYPSHGRSAHQLLEIACSDVQLVPVNDLPVLSTASSM